MACFMLGRFEHNPSGWCHGVLAELREVCVYVCVCLFYLKYLELFWRVCWWMCRGHVGVKGRSVLHRALPFILFFFFFLLPLPVCLKIRRKPGTHWRANCCTLNIPPSQSKIPTLPTVFHNFHFFEIHMKVTQQQQHLNWASRGASVFAFCVWRVAEVTVTFILFGIRQLLV